MAPSGWCQRFSLAGHCTYQYPSSPGFLCCFARCLGCAALLYVWLCAHLRLGLGFLMLHACPSPSIGLLVYWFQWLLLSSRVPYLRDGVTPAGSRIVCPRSERRFSLPFGSGTLVSSWLDLPPLSAGICAPCPSGCVAKYTRCIHELRLSLALSNVLHCPLLGFRVTSPSLARGRGVVFGTLPSFLPAGVGASVGGSALRSAAAGALFLGGPL